jgi:hypothetical protein
MSEPKIPPDPVLTDLEAALGSLAPASSRIDRDRIMFESGKQSRRDTPRWAWPSIAATLMVVVLGEAAALVSRPEARIVERVVIIREPVEPDLAPVTILSQEPPAITSRVFRPRRLDIDSLNPTNSEYESRATASVTLPEPSGALLRSELARLLHPGEHL